MFSITMVRFKDEIKKIRCRRGFLKLESELGYIKWPAEMLDIFVVNSVEHCKKSLTVIEYFASSNLNKKLLDFITPHQIKPISMICNGPE